MPILPNPEFIPPITYEFTMRQTLLKQPSLPVLSDVVVDQEVVEQFMTEPCLELGDVAHQVASLHFAVQPKMLIKHGLDLAEQLTSETIDSTGLEVVMGTAHRFGDFFLACGRNDETVSFRNITDILVSGSLNDYERNVLQRLSYNGQYEDPITYALQKLVAVEPTPTQSELF